MQTTFQKGFDNNSNAKKMFRELLTPQKNNHPVLQYTKCFEQVLPHIHFTITLFEDHPFEDHCKNHSYKVEVVKAYTNNPLTTSEMQTLEKELKNLNTPNCVFPNYLTAVQFTYHSQPQHPHKYPYTEILITQLQEFNAQD